MSVEVTLGGLPLLAGEAVSWPIQAGATSSSGDFLCEPSVADELRELRFADLRIGDDLIAANLIVLAVTPSDAPYTRRVRVVDRRYFWDRLHVLRRYNMRRATSFFRTTATDVPELERVAPLIAYARYSVKPDGSPWTALEALEDYIAELGRKEQLAWGGDVPPLTLRVLSKYVQQWSAISVEDVEVDDVAQTSLPQLLAALPGAQVVLERDGTQLTVYDASDTEEDARIVNAVPQIVSGSYVELVNPVNEAPRMVSVWFSVQAELRFDVLERVGQSVTPDPDEAEPVLRNVLPVPDYQIEVAGSTAVQGTWVGIDDYLAALPAPPAAGVPRLTQETLRRAAVPFMDLWAAVVELGVLDPDADWAARVAALRQHFRLTYRLPRAWHDSVLAWRAERVATVDQSTGARAPATAYSDYFVVGSQRMLLRDYNRGNQLAYGVNVERGVGPGQNIGPDSKPSPAFVSLADAEQGIMSLAYQLDPLRFTEMILPSKLTEPPGYTDAEQGGERPLTFDSLQSAGSNLPELDRNHRLSVILSAIPAAPNGPGQLYRVDVRPQDVTDALSPAAREVALQARGPVRDVRVQPGLEVARVRWLDSRADDIRGIFGFGNTPPNLDGLVVNAAGSTTQGTPGQPVDGAPLDQIARAIAARVWSTFAPRYEGQLVGPRRTGLTVRGRASAVQHSILPSGAQLSSASFPPSVPELSWLTLVDQGTRSLLLREAYR